MLGYCVLDGVALFLLCLVFKMLVYDVCMHVICAVCV